MRKQKQKSFQSLIRVLRERCPALAPIRVRRVQLKDRLGDCIPRWGDQGCLLRFDIRINREISWDATWQTLLHEWAHALVWTEGETIDHHDETWGIALSHCYRESE